AGTLLMRGWLTEGFRDAAQASAWRDRTRGMVEEYTSRLDPAEEPAGVERTVATKTDVIAVSGRIDRLDFRDEGRELAVVDYKTGRRPLTTDDARSSLALALYAIASSRVLRRPCRTVELHHLPTGEVSSWEHTDESLGRHLRRAEQIATECADADEAYRTRLAPGREKIQKKVPVQGAQVEHAVFDAVFPPSTGPLCGWCDYQRHCPQGQQAAAKKEPWAALGDDPVPATT
ncbi:MAG: PD-(D/E)XK nuclease family protein, partial [Streptosporangiaceae bacterium]